MSSPLFIDARAVAAALPWGRLIDALWSAFRNAGDTRVPVLISWFGFVGVRMPLAYLLTRPSVDLGALGTIPGADLGLFGAWIAMCVDIWVRGLFFVARFATGRWKTIEV